MLYLLKQLLIKKKKLFSSVFSFSKAFASTDDPYLKLYLLFETKLSQTAFLCLQALSDGSIQD